MAHDVIRRLSKIPNLIYISANRFVPGWEGDFKKKRPSNISITHAYSDLFVNSLQKFAKIIDLRVWSHDDIKHYTCDNIHLTRAGNDYIYDEIVKYVAALHKNDTVTGTRKHMDNALASEPRTFRHKN